MNPERLLQNFDRLIDTPDAIPRLRRFILDLAVRGKLVEQNPEDEPGSSVLEYARNKKNQLILERGIRKERDVEYSVPDSLLDIPTNWTWAHIDDVAIVQGGKRLPQGASFSMLPTPHFYIRVTDMKNGTIVADDLRYITPEVRRSIARYTINKEDLYITIAGTIGDVGRVPSFFDGHNLTENAAKLVFRSLNADFLCLALRSVFVQQQFQDKTNQLAQSKLALKRILGAKLPLPPLAEQHRIVVKVDELMKLCDELEAAQSKRERRRDRLVSSTLHGLNNGESSNGNVESFNFEESARFYFNHLPRLTTRPEHIRQLRQTILNLAVRGKLDPQDPTDEPAMKLLKRITAEKEQLVKEGAIKKQAELPTVADEEMPFVTPVLWEWVRFGDLIIDSDAGWSPKCEGFSRSGESWGVLKVSAVSWNKFMPEENKQLLPGVSPPESAQVRAGDFLISRANTSDLVAKCVVVNEQPRNLILSDKIVRLRIAAECNKHFLSLVNNHAEHARSYYARKASGTSLSMKNVSRAVIYYLPIALPPLAEQNRIVARVNELMSLCDELENRLTINASSSRQLLNITLTDALFA
jgi:type I restriction enzyme, S subunit